MYPLVLTLHSLVRWVVVVLALVTVGRAFYGWLGGKRWDDLDDRLGLFFSISLDVQVLLGLLLYFALSPTVTAALRDAGRLMADVEARYWTVEHAVPMLIALVLVHVGRVLIRRAPEGVAKYRRAALLMGVATLIILASIPWPFSPLGRPLFRLG